MLGTEVLVVPRRVMSRPSHISLRTRMGSRNVPCVKSHYAMSRPRRDGSRIYPEILCRQITSCVCVSSVERPLLLTSLILYALCFVLCRYLPHTSGICLCRTQMFCFVTPSARLLRLLSACGEYVASHKHSHKNTKST